MTAVLGSENGSHFLTGEIYFRVSIHLFGPFRIISIFATAHALAAPEYSLSLPILTRPHVGAFSSKEQLPQLQRSSFALVLSLFVEN